MNDDNVTNITKLEGLVTFLNSINLPEEAV
jgi:hypothetical protein